MERKELIAVLLLGLLVLILATVRVFSTPLPTASSRRSSTGRRRPPPPTRHDRGFNSGLWRPRSDGFPPRDPGARNLYDAAEVAYGNGLFDAAIQIYEHFREEHRIDPAAEMALLRIAQSYTLMKRHKEAAQHYELFLKWYPRAEMRPLALLWSGRSHLFIGDTKVARERLAEVVAQFPQSAFADTARDDLKQLDARPPAPPGPVPATRTAPRDEQ